MAYRERMRVAYADIDVMNHVNNAKYFTYMETARCHYYEQLTGIRQMRDLDIIVAAQSCQYLRGLQYDESFDVVVWPSRVGDTSFTLSYAVQTKDQEVVALAETVIVAYDYEKQSKKSLDPSLRARLVEHMKEGPGIPLPTRRSFDRPATTHI